MTTHSIKGLREQFKAQGKFHTPPELAAFLPGWRALEPYSAWCGTCEKEARHRQTPAGMVRCRCHPLKEAKAC